MLLRVTAEKSSPYKKIERNELATQMYQLGVFSPQRADQALSLLDTMDFEGKDKIIQRVQQNGTIYEMMTNYLQIALQLAERYEPEIAQQLMADAQGNMQSIAAPGGGDIGTTSSGGGGSTVEKARAAAQERTQPNS